MGGQASTAARYDNFGKSTSAKEVFDHFSGGNREYLRGKTFIVTGGNSGIGLETSKILSYGGAKVILKKMYLENCTSSS